MTGRAGPLAGDLEQAGPVPVCDDRDLVGEGPVWSRAEGALFWVDIRGRRVRRLRRASGEVQSFACENLVGSLARTRDGRLIVAEGLALTLLDVSDGSRREIARARGPAGQELPGHFRLNDGKCDARGRFWVGLMNDVDRRPEGALCCFDPARPEAGLVRKLEGVVLPNGLCWSPDGRTLYFADSLRQEIMAIPFDVEAGELGQPRTFARATGAGLPDGATVDRDGFVWSARYGASSLVRYAPDGRVDRVLRLPFLQPTSCAFGGEELDELYVTSAIQNMTAADLATQPMAGCLVRVESGCTGLPEPEFGPLSHNPARKARP